MRLYQHININKSVLFGLAAVILLNGCTAETLCHDSDGDGLSDCQESHFGTNPESKDSDNDTIPDGEDESPLVAAQVLLEASIAGVQISDSLIQAEIRVLVRDQQQRWINDVPVIAHTTAGTLSEVENPGTGLYRVILTSPVETTAIVSFETVDELGQPNGRGSDSIQVKLTRNASEPVDDPIVIEDNLISENQVVLEEPGLNPGRYANAGPMNGELWVMAIDGQTLDWSDVSYKGFEGAYVQVDFDNGESIHGKTNEAGWIHFVDERLKSPVNVTVGAKNSRYVTWMSADARVISAGIHARDILASEANTKGGMVTGVVRGFNGETGLPSFPSENANPFGTFNVAIVNVGIRNYPLSSMNSGSILLPPDGSNQSYFDIPPNFILANMSSPDKSKYKINKLVPGKYIIFALAGTGSNVTAALQNPYKLKFVPYAMGISEIEVKAGETIHADIDLSIDLRTGNNPVSSLYFGQLPPDPRDGQPLPMGLVLPVINTGKGFIYADVKADYNADGFQNPMSLAFPGPVHSTLVNLGLVPHNMIVGIAGRPGQKGYDQPGISTMIAHPKFQDSQHLSTEYMNDSHQWALLPEFVKPAPPADPMVFDAVGGKLNPDREIKWKSPEDSDVTVLRFNYMTPPIHNKLIGTDIGASQAHSLWEVYVPAPAHEIVLPQLDIAAPDYPVLVNYEPTSPDAAYHYGKNTVELEINVHYMGPKKFRYNSNFLISDVNLSTWAVSQDSYLIDVSE